jgi:hypothetical protein
MGRQWERERERERRGRHKLCRKQTSILMILLVWYTQQQYRVQSQQKHLTSDKRHEISIKIFVSTVKMKCEVVPVIKQWPRRERVQANGNVTTHCLNYGSYWVEISGQFHAKAPFTSGQSAQPPPPRCPLAAEFVGPRWRSGSGGE